MLLGPPPNSQVQVRIPEIYDLTECCCSPRQTHNSGVPQLFFRMPPLASPRTSCCSPSETQNLDVCNITSTIDTIKIIKKPEGFPSKLESVIVGVALSYAFSFKNVSNYKLFWSAWFWWWSTTFRNLNISLGNTHFLRSPWILDFL